MKGRVPRALTQREVCVYPSLIATSEDEVNMWIKGLTWLTEDTLQAATPLQIER